MVNDANTYVQFFDKKMTNRIKVQLINVNRKM